ncbi:MAG: ribosomal protein methyltransferase [Pseudomonadota bacterium]|jgi:ribosomal protein L11 methyltransferase
MDQYFCLRIEIAPRELAWLAECLAQLGSPVFEEQRHGARSSLLVYDQSRDRLAQLAGELRSCAAAALPAVALSSSLALAPQDWALRWTEYLEPVQLTPSLTLQPSRGDGSSQPGVLFLEPAFAFGFGEHATTRLMAAWLEARCREQPGCSVLDVGCGTGVLALVASKSGAGRVVGVDTSEAAVLAARANALQNGLSARFEQRAADALHERFDLVVANIEAHVLLAASEGLVRCVGGALALAGFIHEQVEELVQHYAARGAVLQQEASDGDWCLLAGRLAP